MLLVYNLSIRIYYLLISLVSLVNPKAKLWIKGRKGLLFSISQRLDADQKKVWFHFPSLGEFEQGRPVLEQVKSRYPNKIIVVTFFSPSGFEIRKNYPLADHIFYLPLDTAKNAGEFIRVVNPEIAIFTKYDYWYHYFKELNRKKIPLYVISAIFRENQVFFKWYGAFQRRTLSYVSVLFVQDNESKDLLEKINILNVTVSGDTRFDRVAENARDPKVIPEIKEFCSELKVFIAGSTWSHDEKLIAQLTTKFPQWKFIIAPHEISESRINAVEKLFPGATKYSALKENTKLADSQVLIIDNIGLLSSLYQFADVAFIGGGFGVGIHNTLEAAVFNLPVIFGPNFSRFREARDLVNIEAAFSIKEEDELKAIMTLLQDSNFLNTSGKKAGEYVRQHIGATDIILKNILLN